MTSQRRWVLVAVSVLAAAGCVAPGTAVETEPEVSVTTVGAMLRDPVWSYSNDALVGLTDAGRVAEITDLVHSGHAKTRLSAPIAAGRNLQISRKDDQHVYVPQPQRGKVAVLDLGTLRQVDEFDAGPAPAYLSEDGGMRVLLALSADGSSVTPVDEYGFRKLPTAKINGDPSDTIDGANRGRDIEYHVSGPSGIRFYRGPSSPPEKLGSIPMGVASSAGDGAAVTRSYVARPNGDIIYVIDLRRAGKGLKVRAATQLPSPIRRIGSDDTRIYAATDREVATLETNSFMRFEADIIPVLRITNYRTALPESQRSAPLSGMAVGPHRVYLTFKGTPLVVSVAKPHM
ncbi:MAG: hypothetical protein WB785_16385 [Mycobacterium sp.]|uniref:hypothetical protein n=1 Tax=Mycobacterium sp. TaxID=1785 RepID=UPI003C4DBE5C